MGAYILVQVPARGKIQSYGAETKRVYAVARAARHCTHAIYNTLKCAHYPAKSNVGVWREVYGELEDHVRSVEAV